MELVLDSLETPFRSEYKLEQLSYEFHNWNSQTKYTCCIIMGGITCLIPSKMQRYWNPSERHRLWVHCNWHSIKNGIESNIDYVLALAARWYPWLVDCGYQPSIQRHCATVYDVVCSAFLCLIGGSLVHISFLTRFDLFIGTMFLHPFYGVTIWKGAIDWIRIH